MTNSIGMTGRYFTVQGVVSWLAPQAIRNSPDAFPGAVDAALLFKDQAARAGITINLVREPDDGYWSKVWRQKNFVGVDWYGRATVDWLTRRHGLEISCFVLSVFRFGAERLLSIRREYPARDVNAPDPAAEVQRMLSGAATNGEPEPAANGHSTPPPAL